MPPCSYWPTAMQLVEFEHETPKSWSPSERSCFGFGTPAQSTPFHRSASVVSVPERKVSPTAMHAVEVRQVTALRTLSEPGRFVLDTIVQLVPFQRSISASLWVFVYHVPTARHTVGVGQAT